MAGINTGGRAGGDGVRMGSSTFPFTCEKRHCDYASVIYDGGVILFKSEFDGSGDMSWGAKYQTPAGRAGGFRTSSRNLCLAQAAQVFVSERLERRVLLSGTVRFSGEVTFPTGSDPNTVITADINGDGRADLVVTNYYSNTVGVLLGNGNGTFKPEQESSVNHYPTGVSAMDINGDGKMDLAVADSGYNTVSVLLGNGNGTFQTQRVLNVASNPLGVALRDLNGDGKVDLAVTNEFGNSASNVIVFLGNGNGTFGAQQTFPGGTDPGPLAVADINGDGKQDLVFGNLGQSTVSILPGNGNGTFGALQTVAVGTNPNSIVVIDLNGDNKIDIACVNDLSNANSVSVLLGNGNGTFAARQSYAAGMSPPSLAAGDFNADGKLDLAVSSGNARAIGILVGNGDGTFLPMQTIAATDFPGSLVAADFDGEGTADLATVHSSSNTVGVLLNHSNPPQVVSINRTTPPGPNASGSSVTFTVMFSKPVTGVDASDFSVAATGVTSTGLTVTPVSGSVYTVTVNGLSGTGTLGLNLADNGSIRDQGGQPLAGGTVSFQAPLTFAAGYAPSAVAAADVNGDGKPDLIAVPKSNDVGVLLGNGNGTFRAMVTFPVGLNPNSVAVADVNGDGKLDLVVSDNGRLPVSGPGQPGTISVLLGNGNGTFQAQRTLPGQNYPWNVQIADINGDSKPDILATCSYNSYVYGGGYVSSSRVMLLLGNGNGTFQSPKGLVYDVYAAPTVVDVNGDGKPDLAFGYYYNASHTTYSAVTVLLNNGNDQFQKWSHTLAQIGAVPSIALGDVNGDQKPDLVAALPGQFDLLLGNGNGTFQNQQTFTVANNNGGVEFATDMNNDGNLDLVFPGFGVLLGNGNGTFRSQQTFYVPLGQVADLNGDGRPDYVSVYPGNPGHVDVRLENPVGSFTGQTYTILPLPVVASINRSSPSGAITGATTLTYAVTFSATVTNVSASDFQVITTGDVAAASPAGVSGSGNSYTVTISGVHGNGTLQLNLVDHDTIVDGSGTPLGGTGLANGSFAGQAYTILQTFPTVLSINRGTPPGPNTVDNSVIFAVTFSEAVTGVDPTDFALALGGVTATTPVAVSGSGAVYNVTVSGISGTGTLGLNLVDDGSIKDAAGNPLQNGAGGTVAFQTQHTFAAGGSGTALASGDVNGDGKTDLLVDSSSGVVSVLLGNGNSTFAARQTFVAGAASYSAALADVNGDGKPDLIIVNDTASGTVGVLLGNGNGTFASPATIAVGSQPRSASVADVNADGKPDIVVANSNSVGVLLGNGDGSFRAQQTFAAGTHPYSIAVADLNGDSKGDLIVANLGANSVSVLLGNGNGTFVAQQSSVSITLPKFVAATDVNGDGQFDIIAAGPGGASVLLGNGNGTFQNQQTFATGGGSYGLSISDINGDGKVDLVLANNAGGGAIVMLGNGNGGFQPPQAFSSGAGPVSVCDRRFQCGRSAGHCGSERDRRQRQRPSGGSQRRFHRAILRRRSACREHQRNHWQRHHYARPRFRRH